MSPADLFPTLAPAVQNLANVWPAYVVEPQFAAWQVLHILSLIVLGGASIILNLRLIGRGLTDEPASEVYRNLRLWLNLGVIGIVVTGVLIGMANAERLYNSSAFTAKMLALLGAVILTYGVSAPVARADGEVRRGQRVWLLVGVLVLLLAAWVFSTSRLINPGMFHVLTGAALIVMFMTRGPVKAVYLGGLLALVAAQTFTTHFVVHQGDFPRLDPTNKAFAVVFAAWILGFAAHQLLGDRRGLEGRPLTRTVGYVTILGWVMAAAAGRWIAFA